jgi:hypothetical protein
MVQVPFLPVPYRFIYIGLGLVAIAAIALGVALSGGGEPVVMPEAIESVYPEPGDLVTFQAQLIVDLVVGYEAEIFVDGWRVEDASYVEGTGVYRWSPSPTNPSINEWTPGKHTVRVRYDTINGLPDVGEFEWTFRVG